uniref:Uncharacterized protein n=1 Tax=Rhizophora mucronata TaxID=61149 RepID=A0A2P2NYC4_RHIMU
MLHRSHHTRGQWKTWSLDLSPSTTNLRESPVELQVHSMCFSLRTRQGNL